MDLDDTSVQSGLPAQQRLAASNVLIVGVGGEFARPSRRQDNSMAVEAEVSTLLTSVWAGVGVEIAKNVILAGK